MHRTLHLSAALIFLATLMAPSVASAVPFVPSPASLLFKPFGGQVIGIKYCAIPTGAINFTIKQAGIGKPPLSLIWTQTTKTYLYGPPVSIGQWTLGLAGVTGACVGFGAHPPIWYGLVVHMMGTNLVTVGI